MTELRGCPHLEICAGARAAVAPEPATPFRGLAELRVLSLNHRNLGFADLASAVIGPDEAAALHLSLLAEDLESLVLLTCNRLEVYWRSHRPTDDATALRAVAAIARHPAAALMAAPLAGREAATHLFRVCAGLESAVLGEAEILGQVRAALEQCRGAGPLVNGVVHAALRAAGLVRAQTAIGVGAMSVASAAVRMLAAQVPLSGSRVLVIGAGATGLKAARHLRGLGARDIVIANRTPARATAVAADVNGRAVTLDDVAAEAALADAIVAATAGATPAVTGATLQAVAAARGGRALPIVDLGMPPAVERVHAPGLLHLDLAAIERHVSEQRARRSSEVPAAEAIIAREVEHLQGWARQEAIRPLVSALRRKVEAIRSAELARVHEETDGEIDAAALERLSRRLLDRVLALPLGTLEAQAEADLLHAVFIRRLFALDGGGPSS
ncbi:MAG: glutamyl-tRNA reductase [Vicinamibacterales bacterium]